MIRYHQSGEQVNVHVEKERAPSIYLDQFALFQFSRPGALRDAFSERSRRAAKSCFLTRT